MHLQLKKWRKPQINQSALVIPWQDIDPQTEAVKAKGHIKFSKVGDVQEVPDGVGYGILRTHGDMIQHVTLQQPAAQNKRVGAAPKNKGAQA